MRRYTAVAIGLHWLIALALMCNLALGVYMSDLPLSVGPIKLKLYAYHKWAGVTVFILVMVRIFWRIAHQPPPPAPGTRSWQRVVAGSTHLVLYLLTLAVPLAGWLYSSARGFQTVYFGVLPIPDLLGKDLGLAENLKELHESLAFLMAALIVFHMAAALKHHWVDRDDTLASMLPLLHPRPPGDRS